MACVFLWSFASAETPARTQNRPPAGSSATNPAMEDNPAKLKAFSCADLDRAMAVNYTMTATLTTVDMLTPSPNSKLIADPVIKCFNAERKEFKSRCKGPAMALDAAKKLQRNNKYLPNA
jgi:hypothetical protein